MAHQLVSDVQSSLEGRLQPPTGASVLAKDDWAVVPVALHTTARPYDALPRILAGTDHRRVFIHAKFSQKIALPQCGMQGGQGICLCQATGSWGPCITAGAIAAAAATHSPSHSPSISSSSICANQGARRGGGGSLTGTKCRRWGKPSWLCHQVRVLGWSCTPHNPPLECKLPQAGAQSSQERASRQARSMPEDSMRSRASCKAGSWETEESAPC